MKIWYSILIAGLLITGCSKEKFEEATLTVASHYGTCMAMGPVQCLQVKQGAATQWQGFLNEIEGFNYEVGFEYVINVRIYNVSNPPADGSSKRYVLVKVISKI